MSDVGIIIKACWLATKSRWIRSSTVDFNHRKSPNKTCTRQTTAFHLPAPALTWQHENSGIPRQQPCIAHLIFATDSNHLAVQFIKVVSSTPTVLRTFAALSWAFMVASNIKETRSSCANEHDTIPPAIFADDALKAPDWSTRFVKKTKTL